MKTTLILAALYTPFYFIETNYRMTFVEAFKDVKDAAKSKVSSSNVADYGNQNYDKVMPWK